MNNKKIVIFLLFFSLVIEDEKCLFLRRKKVCKLNLCVSVCVFFQGGDSRLHFFYKGPETDVGKRKS